MNAASAGRSASHPAAQSGSMPGARSMTGPMVTGSPAAVAAATAESASAHSYWASFGSTCATGR